MNARNVTASLLLCVWGLTSCTAAGVATPTPTSAIIVPVTTATTPVTPLVRFNRVAGRQVELMQNVRSGGNASRFAP